jgi:hypothetical protein
MLVTGALLFADGPPRHYGNAAFRVKLLLIGAAVLSGLKTLRVAHRYQHLTVAPLGLKFTAVVSITLFLGAAIAGPVIGVL